NLYAERIDSVSNDYIIHIIIHKKYFDTRKPNVFLVDHIKIHAPVAFWQRTIDLDKSCCRVKIAFTLCIDFQHRCLPLLRTVNYQKLKIYSCLSYFLPISKLFTYYRKHKQPKLSRCHRKLAIMIDLQRRRSRYHSILIKPGL